MRVSLLAAYVFASAFVAAAPVAADGASTEAAVNAPNKAADKPVDKPADKPAEKPAPKAEAPADKAKPAPKAEEKPKAEAEKPKPAPEAAEQPKAPEAAEAADSDAPAPAALDALLPETQTPLLPPLRWSTPFPDAVEAGTDLTLSWEGGSPEFGFEVYYIASWPRQRTYDLVTIKNTTSHSIVWSVPGYDEFPEDTTFILGVKDATGGPGGNWYDLTAPLPLVDPTPDAREFEAAIAAKARA
jgi:hypothetical protein